MCIRDSNYIHMYTCISICILYCATQEAQCRIRNGMGMACRPYNLMSKAVHKTTIIIQWWRGLYIMSKNHILSESNRNNDKQINVTWTLIVYVDVLLSVNCIACTLSLSSPYLSVLTTLVVWCSMSVFYMLYSILCMITEPSEVTLRRYTYTKNVMHGRISWLAVTVSACSN